MEIPVAGGVEATLTCVDVMDLSSDEEMMCAQLEAVETALEALLRNYRTKWNTTKSLNEVSD